MRGVRWRSLCPRGSLYLGQARRQGRVSSSKGALSPCQPTPSPTFGHLTGHRPPMPRPTIYNRTHWPQAQSPSQWLLLPPDTLLPFVLALQKWGHRWPTVWSPQMPRMLVRKRQSSEVGGCPPQGRRRAVPQRHRGERHLLGGGTSLLVLQAPSALLL